MVWLKIIKMDGYHYNHQYRDGLNVLKEKFNDNPEESCCSGGFYFTNAKYIFKYLGYGNYVGVIYLPESRSGFKLVEDITGDRWRANMIILDERYDLSDVNTFKFLVDKFDADISVDNYYALIWAATAGYIDIVKFLVENGADVSVAKDLALRRAAKRGHYEIVKYLVKNGANVSADNDCALIWAAKRGHLKIVEYLVGKGANIHSGHDAAFRLSAENGHLPVVKYLFKCCKPLVDKKTGTEIRHSLSEGCCQSRCSGVNVHSFNDYALRWSVLNGYLSVVKYLVEKCDADIDADDDCALNWSARYNHPAIFKYLVKKGANIDSSKFVRDYNDRIMILDKS